MKLPRPWSRLLIVALAVATGLPIAERLRRGWRDRGRRAAELAAEAESWSRDASKAERMMADPGEGDPAELRVRTAEYRDAARDYRKMSEYYRGLADRYARAAATPWRRMGPEPPPPE